MPSLMLGVDVSKEIMFAYNLMNGNKKENVRCTHKSLGYTRYNFHKTY